MAKTIISEGKTTNEAIENGLKELNVSRKMVEVKVLENEEKRSFFSILAPRIVKVELTVKENVENTQNIENNKNMVSKKAIHLSAEEQEKAVENIEKFIKELQEELPEGTQYTIKPSNDAIYVSLTSEKLGFLIGYRGETLYAMQNVMSAVAGKHINNFLEDLHAYKEELELY